MGYLNKKLRIPTPTFFIFAIILIAYFSPRESKVSYNESEGKPWRYGLVTAPFDFPIYKDEAQLEQERDSILKEYIPYYSVDKFRSERAITLFTNDAQAAETPAAYIQYVQRKMKEIYQAGLISATDYDKLEDSNLKQLYLINEDNVATIRNVNSFYTSKLAYEKLINDLPDNLQLYVIQSLNLNNYLYDNVIADNELSKKAKDELLMKVPFAEGNVLSGQKIIDRGEIVTSKTVHILNSLQKITEQKEGSGTRKNWMVVGDVILIAALIMAFMTYLIFFRPREYYDRRNVLFMLTMIVVLCVLTGVFVKLGFNVYIIPYAMATIMVRTFIDSRTAMLIHLITAIICSLMVPFPQEFLLLQIPVGFMCIFSLKDLSERSQLIKSSFFILLTYASLYIGVTLALKGDIKQIDPLMFLYFAINFMFVMFAYLLVYICEKVFGFISGVSMIELSNINKPLLQQLSEVAPGTFQHSMQVSNLAAAVATRIGANAPLVRTGALYHDIGKMTNPAYFTENQIPGMNPHVGLSYKESARIIINHVPEGIKIARKYNLPQQIIDFIATHHGTGKVKYFYNSYKNEHPDEDVSEADFSYPGPNPFTKETAILMMADTVEAASRSLKEYTEESISHLVDKLVDSQMHDGLLRNAPITFRDIEIAKNIFKEKLMTIYHSRIAYPELSKEAEKNIEDAAEKATI
ncbi:HDIG domain-containing protein [Dysgonomonas sp. HDW5B]|uniref:HD family phosphohydrolase n=1 Tax=Dysgonomonas sp. HDW5B TaxID=2714927 RepID=UPI00140A1262|nr:HDIG domain-containing metalloprotein [Dysgonomonas sp. HDW5B]QIK53592.1 HDIG domain-containing protein [Dysgonomonas sp. HDW5B]